MHEGKKLSDWLEQKKWNAYDLAGELNVTPQSVYNQIKRERLSDSFRLRLQQKNLFVSGGNNTGQSDYEILKEKYDRVIEEVRSIKTDMGLLKEYMSMLKQEVQTLRQKN